MMSHWEGLSCKERGLSYWSARNLQKHLNSSLQWEAGCLWSSFRTGLLQKAVRFPRERTPTQCSCSQFFPSISWCNNSLVLHGMLRPYDVVSRLWGWVFCLCFSITLMFKAWSVWLYGVETATILMLLHITCNNMLPRFCKLGESFSWQIYQLFYGAMEARKTNIQIQEKMHMWESKHY